MITAKRLDELKSLATRVSPNTCSREDMIGLLSALIINEGLMQLASSVGDIGPAVENVSKDLAALAQAVDDHD